jgi:large subunit ribosomal protein L35
MGSMRCGGAFLAGVSRHEKVWLGIDFGDGRGFLIILQFIPIHLPVLHTMASTSRALRGLSVRSFSTSAPACEEVAATTAAAAATTQAPPLSSLGQDNVFTPRAERKLLRTRGLTPIGSRRRRAAILSGSRIPFEQLPYQCFQEARKVLIQHREEKVQDIEAERQKIARLKAQSVDPQNEQRHQHRVNSMQRYLDELKIHADINDPMVKRRFEDGKGQTHFYILK